MKLERGRMILMGKKQIIKEEILKREGKFYRFRKLNNNFKL